jgi:hypothetical protein
MRAIGFKLHLCCSDIVLPDCCPPKKVFTRNLLSVLSLDLATALQRHCSSLEVTHRHHVTTTQDQWHCFYLYRCRKPVTTCVIMSYKTA